MNKYWKNNFFLLIILFFFEGLFTFYGKTSWNFYKIFLPIFAIYIYIREQRYLIIKGRDRRLLITFLLFSLFFFISSFANSDPPLLFLNQYSRYLLPIISFFLIKTQIKRGIGYDRMANLIKDLLNVQIGLSILNFLLMGIHENIVGSMSSNGGAAATVIPILGFVFIWLKNEGILIRKDWIYFILLIFIGFVSNKRAIWILAPLIAMLLVYYVPRRKLSRNFLFIIPLLPLIFYFGIRLNPTLNQEGKIWGSFDFNFFYDYANKYTFGDASEDDVHSGRGGATLLTFESILNPEKEKSLLGNGLVNIYAWKEDAKENSDSPILVSDLNSITMATGIFQNYYTGGLLGLLSFMVFIFTLFFMVKNRRFRIVLILLFFWEYLLYANTIIRIPALSFLFIYLILYSSRNYLKPALNIVNGNAKTSDSLS
jgi:hypothetical protein